MIKRLIWALPAVLLFCGCEGDDSDDTPLDQLQALAEGELQGAEGEVADGTTTGGTGPYPWSGQSVEVVGSRYHAVQDYAETASLTGVSLGGGRIRFGFSPNPPWSEYTVSHWRAQGSLCVIRNEGGRWRKYWGDYFERDRYNRGLDEIAHHMGGGPGSGETVWICACDGDRARRGSQRTNWVQVKWP